jgi:hypothetical protein
VAEHHFSNQYGIMPDVFTYMGYLAARTTRTAVVTLPLYDPVRVVENMAFVDILSGGRASRPCSFTIRRTTATRRRWRACVASRRR